MRRPRQGVLLVFLLAQILTGALVFRGALTGSSLLAPLDIAPAFLAHYRYLDPRSDGVPANHLISDQLLYDLPMQHTIYEAYRRGHVPWWDPWLLAGRPLLADAHISGTDPVRVAAYRLLDFEHAYNATRILHFLLAGLGMLLLLRRLGVPGGRAVPLALAYQFAGCFALQFGHPWIHASFVYYPYLWIVWSSALQAGHWSWRHTAVAAALAAAILYAGNLQSHAYLAVFSLAFTLGHARRQPALWRKAAPLVVATGALGALLAAPVLAVQIELLLTGGRELDGAFGRLGWLGGAATLSGVYPWVLGTFRTLDLSRGVGSQFHLGFSVFIGSAAFVLALLGAVHGRVRSAPGDEATDPDGAAIDIEGGRRTALWLFLLYLLIVSTPLVRFFYARSAPLAVMGLVVLAAFGIEWAIRSDRTRRVGAAVLVVCGLLVLSTNAFAFLAYPRLRPTVERVALARPIFQDEPAPALRLAQVERLPSEISFLNIETVFAALGLLMLALLLMRPELRKRSSLWAALLVVNLIPPVLFMERFVPRHPIAQWEALRAGGPQQQAATALLSDSPLRLWEGTLGARDQLFPAALGHLYRVRTGHGYAALYPRSLAQLPYDEQQRLRAYMADWFHLGEPGAAAGELVRNPSGGLARFHWQGESERRLQVREPELDRIRIELDAGPAGSLLWTDSHYRGWRARLDGQPIALRATAPTFTSLSIPETAAPATLVLRYRPAPLVPALVLAVATLLALVAKSARPPKRPGTIREGESSPTG